MSVTRIDAQRAHDDLDAGALLVCAYDDTETSKENQLEGGRSLADFQAEEDSISKDQEVIFYCACPNEETSSQRAEEYQAKGFTNTKVLRGGVKAWRNAGYRMERV